MTLKDWIRKKVLKTAGLVRTDSLQAEEERLTFINNDEEITRGHIHEYNIWYTGDGDELLNFYTQKTTLEYNFEPWYSRNKRAYFWSINSTESDIKRTHSGQPRNIVDTLVSIIKFPLIKCEYKDNGVDILNNIIKDCKLKEIYKNKQMPLTFVEGWGCYKINWDLDLSDYPYPIYYRAEQVDFIYKADRIIGVIYKDYYTDGENRKYLLTETRTIKVVNGQRSLAIEKDLFRANSNSDYIDKIDEDWNNVVPELGNAYKNRSIVFEGYDSLLSVPCIFYENTSRLGGPGRSIFTGKIDLFDDLDQCLSQASNTVRKSTPVEYFNSDFLERDENTGLPKQPKVYDRKYVMYAGGTNADGTNTGLPVQISQPNVDFMSYSNAAIQILLQIINGVMSPATLGIDIAKKDNAEAQREKEKQTIFTRNFVIDTEEDILRSLSVQLIDAYYLMHKGSIPSVDYGISIKFSEFADDSYENKLGALGKAFDQQLISEEMYMQKLYGDTLSDEEYQRELDWLKQNHTNPAAMGAAGGPFGAMGGMNPEAMQEMIDSENQQI